MRRSQVPKQLDAETEIRRRADPLFTQVDEELLALDVDGGRVLGLNSSAARVWELIASPVTLQQLCERLAAEYVVDPEVCLSDVSELLRDMERARLIETSAP